MMGSQERSALIKSIVTVIREHAAPIHAAIQSLREEFELKFREIPEGKPGRDADPVPIDQIIAEVVWQVPAPKDGRDGANGKDGSDGPAGKDGATGAPGIAGERGEKGERGDPGERGEDGTPGEQGPTGERGNDGASIQGPKGDPGPTGDRGENGERGEKGEQGLAGERGLVGDRGEKGETGERGETGARGLAGESGRDALQIEILPGVDELKRFPRGTFARYQNGLIRSFRDTDPLTGELEKCGWEVIVAGFVKRSIIQGDDYRSFEFSWMLTGGTEQSERFQIPSIIYREVHQSGGDYTRGDAVTWDGSVWICVVESTRAKPGTSNDWKLAVKHGERGKDLRAAPEIPKPGPVTLK